MVPDICSGSLWSKGVASGSHWLAGETEGAPEDSGLASIARLFRWVVVSQEQITDSILEEETEVSEEEVEPTDSVDTPEPVKLEWLMYVGRYDQYGRSYFIFKDRRINRIYELTEEAPNSEGWRYIGLEGDQYYLEKDGVIYFVDR